jgi:anti-anti-sigma factor
MPAPVVIEMRQDGPVARLTLTGELDLAGASSVTDPVAAYLGTAGINEVIVDIAPLTFIDSAGVSALVKGKQLSLDVGKTFRIVGSHGRVAVVLDICGLTAYLTGINSDR